MTSVALFISVVKYPKTVYYIAGKVAKIVKKANTMLFLPSKSFSKASPVLFVRPILKFANFIWAPVLQKDIAVLESVQSNENPVRQSSSAIR